MELILQRGLPHQQKAVEAISTVFQEIRCEAPKLFYENPTIPLANTLITANIRGIQKGLPAEFRGAHPSRECLNLDIKMETGERVIIVMGAVNVMKPRVSGTLNKYILCIA